MRHIRSSPIGSFRSLFVQVCPASEMRWDNVESVSIVTVLKVRLLSVPAPQIYDSFFSKDKEYMLLSIVVLCVCVVYVCTLIVHLQTHRRG